MVSSAARRIKLSKNLKPFVSRVNRSGAVQIAFAEQIGRPVGGCVASGVRSGMSGAEIHQVARKCAASSRGTVLDVAGARSRLRGGRRALAPKAGEYYEVE